MNTTPNAAQAVPEVRIVAVIRVTDTREYVEDRDDRWVPVAGSGTSRECDRCGRAHEVHAEVALSDGTEAIVGTGCMKADSLEVAATLRRAVAADRRARALRAELAALEQWNTERLRAIAAAELLEAPAIELHEQAPTIAGGRSIPVASCGTSRLWLFSRTLEQVRGELIALWRHGEAERLVLQRTGKRNDWIVHRLAVVRHKLQRAAR